MTVLTNGFLQFTDLHHGFTHTHPSGQLFSEGKNRRCSVFSIRDEIICEGYFIFVLKYQAHHPPSVTFSLRFWSFKQILQTFFFKCTIHRHENPSMTPISNFKSTNTGTNNLKRNVLNSGYGGVGNFVSKNKRKRNKEKATKQIHKQNPV